MSSASSAVGRVLAVRAQDEAAARLAHQRLQAGAQGLPLLRGNFLRDADVVVLRQEHQQAPRDADLRGQPRALGADRVLDHLHHQGLALEHLPLDGHLRQAVAHEPGRLALGLPVPDVGHVQERRAFESDIDESRLHAGQHPRHLAQVHVADQAALEGALHVQFLYGAVFDDRHPRFLGGPVDQDVLLHGLRITHPRLGSGFDKLKTASAISTHESFPALSRFPPGRPRNGAANPRFRLGLPSPWRPEPVAAGAADGTEPVPEFELPHSHLLGPGASRALQRCMVGHPRRAPSVGAGPARPRSVVGHLERGGPATRAGHGHRRGRRPVRADAADGARRRGARKLVELQLHGAAQRRQHHRRRLQPGQRDHRPGAGPPAAQGGTRAPARLVPPGARAHRPAARAGACVRDRQRRLHGPRGRARRAGQNGERSAARGRRAGFRRPAGRGVSLRQTLPRGLCLDQTATRAGPAARRARARFHLPAGGGPAGQVDGIFVLVTDVTDRARAENALRMSNWQLAEERARLAATVEAEKRAQAALRRFNETLEAHVKRGTAPDR